MIKRDLVSIGLILILIFAMLGMVVLFQEMTALKKAMEVKKEEKPPAERIPTEGSPAREEISLPATAEEIPSRKELEKIPKEAWKEIVSFEGEKGIKTRSFFVPTVIWKIDWKLEFFSEKAGTLKYKLYRASDNWLMEEAEDRYPEGMTYSTTTTYFFRGKTDVYLIIEPTNLKSWKAKISSLEKE